MSDDYLLRRDAVASARSVPPIPISIHPFYHPTILTHPRLNLQHYIWNEAFGYTIHPSTIPKLAASSTSNPILIADIGAGTAVWSLQVSSVVPNCHVTALDISSAQFPAQRLLPSNVTTGLFDVKKEPAEELKGKFDVVHLRHLYSLIDNDDPVPMMENCVKLLSTSLLV